MSEIVKLLSQVMAEVGAVRKGEKNQAQNFNFRGIDAVVNAVSPALRKHSVVVAPQVMDYQHETVQTSQGKNMASVRVLVRYTFTAPDGSTLETVVPGESFDAGDKATAKAMSVAFRIALLQALCLPTDDVDPDATSYERAPSRVSQNHPAAQQVTPRPSQPKPEPSTDVVVRIDGAEMANAKQLGKLRGLCREAQLDNDDTKTFIEATIGRGYATLNDITKREASQVITALEELTGKQ